jgi:Leu/Phe-tRNA-protein transferase
VSEILQRAGCGWMDVQMVTPTIEAFGGEYIRRSRYFQWLQRAKDSPRSIDFSKQKFFANEFLGLS